MAFSMPGEEVRLSMKIKKVDDKPMLIHTKKKMKLHTKKADNKSYIQKDIKDLVKKKAVNNEMITTSKGKWSFRKKVNEANSSIKIKSQWLKVAGAVSAGAVTNQIEGGKEVNEAAGIVVAVSSPSIRGARMSARAIRQQGMQMRKQRLKKVEAGKKIAKRGAKKAAKSSVKKITKSRTKRVAKKTAKETGKAATNVAAQVSTIAAGSSAGPYGMFIGAAAGKADRDKNDNITGKATVRMRKLKFFHNKLQKQDKQKDSLGKLVKDLLMGNLKNIAMKVMAILAPILMMLLPLIIIAGAIVGIVMAVIAFIYSTPLAWFLPPLDNGESVNDVASSDYSDFVREYTDAADKHTNYQMGKIVFEGENDNFNDVIAVYMVKYGVGDMAADMTDKNKQNLKKVLDDMCSYTTSTGTETVTENGKSVSKTCLYVSVKLKTATDLSSEYNFSDSDKEWLEKLLNPSPL